MIYVITYKADHWRPLLSLSRRIILKADVLGVSYHGVRKSFAPAQNVLFLVEPKTAEEHALPQYQP